MLKILLKYYNLKIKKLNFNNLIVSEDDLMNGLAEKGKFSKQRYERLTVKDALE